MAGLYRIGTAGAAVGNSPPRPARRPLSLSIAMDRILGQDSATEVLRSALRSGRLHHAWIFSGPRGVGKFTCAIEFARILLDPDAAANLAGEIEADPHGRTSRLIDAGTHPDLHIIRKELALFSENAELRRKKLANIPIDVLREHVIGGKTGDERIHEAPAYRTATLGHGKVFIIDEAELIDATGQNALLKTLEEPPAQTYIILVTARPERLFPTIRSRCQHVRFGSLDKSAMGAWFERSGPKVDADERAWIEQFCQGSPGLARLAADYGFHEWAKTLAPMLRRLDHGEFPATMGQTLAEQVESFASDWVKTHRNASKDAANKDGAGHVLALLAAHARRRLNESCARGEEPQQALAMIDRLREAERQLASNVNLKHVLENLVVQWAQSASETVGA
jgi:DNA polymerase-3 subunit delta'